MRHHGSDSDRSAISQKGGQGSLARCLLYNGIVPVAVRNRAFGLSRGKGVFSDGASVKLWGCGSLGWRDDGGDFIRGGGRADDGGGSCSEACTGGECGGLH